MKKLSFINQLRQGFTLIELLIVIAVLGVLAAVIVSAIDPIDKVNAGNDAKVIQDMSVIGNALETYAVNNSGVYPDHLATNPLDVLKTNGDLKSIPTPPSGYTGCTNYNYTRTLTSGVYTFTLSCTLKSKKYTATPKHIYDSGKGTVCNMASSATSC